MADKLSFFIPKSSPLHRANPLTKLVYAFSAILIAYFSPWYWTATALVVVNILLGFVGNIQREYLNVVRLLLLPIVGFVFVMQSLFLPHGQTVLFELWFLQLSLENLQTAYINASRIFLMVSSFILLIQTTHPSELMTDLTRRGLPGQLAYIIISTLQILPQMRAKANTIIDAQRSRGMETEGGLRKRVGALLPLVGPLVFGSLVDVEERAIAIEARGFTARHVKTSLKEIPDTRLEQIGRWVMLALIPLAIGARIWLS
jgi:energy-coupling factor transport system permease protein